MTLEDKLYALMQLAAVESSTALSEIERAMFSAHFYRTLSWERRLQKLSARLMRADTRLSESKSAYKKHHEETCEECALDRVVNRVASEIIEDHVVEGEIPMEERN